MEITKQELQILIDKDWSVPKISQHLGISIYALRKLFDKYELKTTCGIKPWTTADEERLRAGWNAGKSQRQLSVELGFSRSAVGGKVQRMGLTRTFVNAPGINVWTPTNEELLRTGLKANKSLRQLSAELGISRSALNNKIQKMGLVSRSLVHRTQTPWTADEIATLAALRKKYTSQDKCAVLLGRTRKDISAKCAQLGIDTIPVKRGRPPPNFSIKRGKIPPEKQHREKYVVPAPPKTTDGVAFVDCKIDQCRWIVGQLRCCGKPLDPRASVLRRPYCTEHYDLSVLSRTSR